MGGRSLLNGDPGLPQTPARRENSQLERREKMEGAGFSICIKAGALRLPPFMSGERLESYIRVRRMAIVERLNPKSVCRQYIQGNNGSEWTNT